MAKECASMGGENPPELVGLTGYTTDTVSLHLSNNKENLEERLPSMFVNISNADSERIELVLRSGAGANAGSDSNPVWVASGCLHVSDYEQPSCDKDMAVGCTAIEKGDTNMGDTNDFDESGKLYMFETRNLEVVKGKGKAAIFEEITRAASTSLEAEKVALAKGNLVPFAGSARAMPINHLGIQEGKIAPGSCMVLDNVALPVDKNHISSLLDCLKIARSPLDKLNCRRGWPEESGEESCFKEETRIDASGRSKQRDTIHDEASFVGMNIRRCAGIFSMELDEARRDMAARAAARHTVFGVGRDFHLLRFANQIRPSRQIQSMPASLEARGSSVHVLNKQVVSKPESLLLEAAEIDCGISPERTSMSDSNERNPQLGVVTYASAHEYSSENPPNQPERSFFLNSECMKSASSELALIVKPGANKELEQLRSPACPRPSSSHADNCRLAEHNIEKKSEEGSQKRCMSITHNVLDKQVTDQWTCTFNGLNAVKTNPIEDDTKLGSEQYQKNLISVLLDKDYDCVECENSTQADGDVYEANFLKKEGNNQCVEGSVKAVYDEDEGSGKGEGNREKAATICKGEREKHSEIPQIERGNASGDGESERDTAESICGGKREWISEGQSYDIGHAKRLKLNSGSGCETTFKRSGNSNFMNLFINLQNGLSRKQPSPVSVPVPLAACPQGKHTLDNNKNTLGFVGAVDLACKTGASTSVTQVVDIPQLTANEEDLLKPKCQPSAECSGEKLKASTVGLWKEKGFSFTSSKRHKTKCFNQKTQACQTPSINMDHGLQCLLESNIPHTVSSDVDNKVTHSKVDFHRDTAGLVNGLKSMCNQEIYTACASQPPSKQTEKEFTSEEPPLPACANINLDQSQENASASLSQLKNRTLQRGPITNMWVDHFSSKHSQPKLGWTQHKFNVHCGKRVPSESINHEHEEQNCVQETTKRNLITNGPVKDTQPVDNFCVNDVHAGQKHTIHIVSMDGLQHHTSDKSLHLPHCPNPVQNESNCAGGDDLGNLPNEQGLVDVSAAMVSVNAWRIEAAKHKEPLNIAEAKADFSDICTFCGLSGHHFSECSETLDCELDDLEKRVPIWQKKREKDGSCVCIRCLELGHWGIQCPMSASMAFSHSIKQISSMATDERFLTVKDGNRRGLTSFNAGYKENILCDPTGVHANDHLKFGSKRFEYLQYADVSNSSITKKLQWENGGTDAELSKVMGCLEADEGLKKQDCCNEVASERNAMGKSIKGKQFGWMSEENKGLGGSLTTMPPCKDPLCIFSREAMIVPKGVLALIEMTWLSRTDILKWMESPDFSSRVEGFFLRMRFGKWEEELGGTGFRMARIVDATRMTEHGNKAVFLSVNLGYLKCLVDCRYVSNQIFAEDEITEWWRATLMSGQQLPSEDEIKAKLEEKQRWPLIVNPLSFRFKRFEPYNIL